MRQLYYEFVSRGLLANTLPDTTGGRPARSGRWASQGSGGKVMAVAMLLLVGCNQPQTESRTVPGPFAVRSTPTTATSWAPAPRTKSAGCSIKNGLPEPACTPGAIDPKVTQTNISTTICSRGYTATVRPSPYAMERIKLEEMAAYGLEGQRLDDYQLDHLISLELGGSPADMANVWPEPWVGEGNAHQKDATENFLNREVCRGTVPLIEAQRQIATDWLAVYRQNGLKPSS